MIPSPQLNRFLDAALSALSQEDPWVRPPDSQKRPGGLVLLKEDLPTWVLPDIHGRLDLVEAFLAHPYQGQSIEEGLIAGKIQVVFLGDGMHSELRGRARWVEAMEEYRSGFAESPAMDAEMEESLGTMARVMDLKARCGARFHFLKGNHENILDRSELGDHSFAKFAAEGAMTKAWVLKNLGPDFLDRFARFEQALPLAARGRYFVLSHSRPRQPFGFNELINHRDHPQVIEGLTWTRDHQAEAGTIRRLFKELLGGDPKESLWVSGHTPVAGDYRQDTEEGLLLLHNPNRWLACVLEPGGTFDAAKAVVNLQGASA
ncbi:MAG: metallophosphoesterase [bacterium]|nr:metallophosphoesterase [bacterium]